MMHVIDVRRWRRFHLYDEHMFDIDMGNKFDRSKMETSINEVNFVGRTAINNGVNATCALVKNVAPYSPGSLSLALGGSIGACFVQERRFYTSQNVIVLTNKDDVSLAAKLFVSTVIQQESNLHYQAFINELNPHIKTDFTIPLPSTDEGIPDWNYMDRFMTVLLKQNVCDVKMLLDADTKRSPVNSDEWIDFKIEDLFVIQKGTRLTRADMLPGETPFIGATLENNGITAMIGNKGHIHPGGVMTVAYNGQKATGKAFWQPKPFWASDDVNVLYPKFELTKEAALFLQPLFWEAGRPYSFGDKWGKDVMEKTTIRLPVRVDGDPDWRWMGDYMKNTLCAAERNISELQSAVPVNQLDY